MAGLERAGRDRDDVMSKLLWIVLGVPVGIVLVALGVANREPLTISLDPFRPGNPALSIHPPLFIAFFVVLAAGVLIGGIAMWISHYKVRRALHRARLDLYRLQSERDQLIADRAAGGGTTVPALSGPRRVA
jgi:hypothetical protein